MIHLLHIDQISLKRTFGCGTSLHFSYRDLHFHSQDYKNLDNWFVSFTESEKTVQSELRTYTPTNSKRDLWDCYKYSLTRKNWFDTDYAAKRNNLNSEWLYLAQIAKNLKDYPHLFLLYDDNTKQVANIYYDYLTWYFAQ